MESAATLIAGALGDSTVTQYSRQFRQYLDFCSAQGVPRNRALPPSDPAILSFITQLFIDNATSGSAGAALTAIRSSCRLLGYDPAAVCSTQLEYLMRSFKRLRPSRPRGKRLPATYPVLAKWCRALKRRGDHVAATLLLVMFHGFLRPGEATAAGSSGGPLRAHVTFFDDHCILHLPESKTDVFSRGIDIHIAANGSDLCPLAALRALFQHASNKALHAPLFQTSATGSAVTYDGLTRIIKLSCSITGMDSALYKPHSIRIGAATTAAVLGFPADVIKHLGRWSSACYQIYTRMTHERFASVSQAFASSRAFSLVPSEFGALSNIPATDVSFDNLDVVFGNR